VVPEDDLVRHQHRLLVGSVRGLIYPEEDTPDFVAKYINRHFENYIEALKPPFFGRVIEFNESSNEVWTCPGHNGGMFYRKSPVGHIFYEYLGEAVFYGPEPDVSLSPLGMVPVRLMRPDQFMPDMRPGMDSPLGPDTWSDTSWGYLQ